MVSMKVYSDIDLRKNRLLNFAVESVSGDLPSEANEGAVIYHSGEGVLYQRLKDGWKVIASGKDLEDALSKVSEDLQALSRDTEEALDTKADKTTVASLSNTLTKEIQDRVAGDNTNATAISTHVANKSNPHDVTKAQVGLGNVDNTSDVNKPISTATQNALDTKADKTAMEAALNTKQDKLVAGSHISIAADGKTISSTYGVASTTANGLMSSTDKSKLDGIASGAQVNSITGVKGNAESTYRTGNVNITKANIGLGNVDNTSDANKPISTAVQNALNGKAGTSVATQSANGLMSSADKKKLDGIASGAQVNVIETVKVNGTALTPSSKAVNIDLSDYARKSDVTTVMRYKGSVATFSDLLTMTATLGDTYNVIDTNANYTWDGSAWDLIGSTVDLSGYATKTEVDGALSGKVSKSGDTMTGDLKIARTGGEDYLTLNRTDLPVDAEINAYAKGSRVSWRDSANFEYAFIHTAKDGGNTRMFVGTKRNVDGTDKVSEIAMYASSNGITYAIAPSVKKYVQDAETGEWKWVLDKSDNSTKIATTEWVNQSDFLVHTTGNESIAGVKTFTGITYLNTSYGNLRLNMHNLLQSSTPPTSRQVNYTAVKGLDKDGKESTVWQLETIQGTDGLKIVQLATNFVNWDDGTSNWKYPFRAIQTANKGMKVETIGTDSNATGTEIATAGWSIGKFVRKTGDTMTGIFKIAPASGTPRIDLIHPNFELSTIPTANCFWDYEMCDKNGKRVGLVEGLGGKDSSARQIGFCLNISTDPNTESWQRMLLINDSNSSYVIAPTPSNKSDNSSKLATTSWISTADIICRTVGNQTIDGYKSFSKSPMTTAWTGYHITLPGMTKGEKVLETNTNLFTGFFDKNDTGTNQPANMMAGLRFTVPPGTESTPPNTFIELSNQYYRDTYLRLYDNGTTAYATCPNPPSDANSNQIATVIWTKGKFVQKTGDTMTGDLVVNNAFIRLTKSYPRLYFKDTTGVIGTTNGGDSRIVFQDKNGTEIGNINNQIGKLDEIDGATYTHIQAVSKKSDGTLVYGSIAVRSLPNGITYGIAPTPSDKADNSSKIATTGWVNQSDFLVHSYGNETVAGKKTFTGNIILDYNSGNVQYNTIVNASKELYGISSFNNTSNIHTLRTPQGTVIRLNCRNKNSRWITLDIINPDDGDPYYEISPTPSTATANQIATASWSIGKFVGLNGDQTIAGEKSFTSTPNMPAIELRSATPFIDFHFGDTKIDYTSRIINDADGQLKFINKTADGSKSFNVTMSTVNQAMYLPVSTPSASTGNEVATANWSIGKFVQKSGDTMSGFLELIYNFPVIRLKSTELAYSDPVSESTTVFALMMNDKNDTFMGGLFNRWYSNGDRKIYLENKGKDGKMGQISLWTNASGVYAEAPTPSDKTDNSTKIATTAWVNQSNFLVHSYGNETISGVKTLTDNLYLHNSLRVMPTASNTRRAVVFNKSTDGSELGWLGYQSDTGNMLINLISGDYVSINKSTPTNANSNEIATANWVNNKLAGKVHISANAPTASDGNDGDIWLQYE